MRVSSSKRSASALDGELAAPGVTAPSAPEVSNRIVAASGLASSAPHPSQKRASVALLAPQRWHLRTGAGGGGAVSAMPASPHCQ